MVGTARSTGCRSRNEPLHRQRINAPETDPNQLTSSPHPNGSNPSAAHTYSATETATPAKRSANPPTTSTPSNTSAPSGPATPSTNSKTTPSEAKPPPAPTSNGATATSATPSPVAPKPHRDMPSTQFKTRKGPHTQNQVKRPTRYGTCCAHSPRSSRAASTRPAAAFKPRPGCRSRNVLTAEIRSVVDAIADSTSEAGTSSGATKMRSESVVSLRVKCLRHKVMASDANAAMPPTRTTTITQCHTVGCSTAAPRREGRTTRGNPIVATVAAHR